MFKKFINGQSSTITSAAVIVASFSILSRVVGFIRDRILAGQFGAGDTLDIYFTAFRVPDFLFQLIVVGALSASFIPLFTRNYSENAREKAWLLTNKLLNLIAIAFGVAILLAIIFMNQLVPFVAVGFDADKQRAVVEMARIMFTAQFFLSISMVFGSALQGAKRFVLYSLAPIFYNFGIIAGAIFFVPILGQIGLAWGVGFGAILHLLLQSAGIFSLGYRYQPILIWKDKDTQYMLKHMAPRVMGLAVNQINFVAMTVIATTLTAGSVTVLQFAYNLNFFPVGVIAISYAIAAFPTFCELLNKNKTEEFIKSFSQTIRQILLFIIPATVMFILLRAQIVRVVLGSGVFDWEATFLTANTLGFFAVSLFAQSIVFVLVRGYFAMDNTITPFIVGLATGLVNIISALILTKEFGVLGLGMAYSISAIVQMIILWIPLRKRLGSLDEGRIFKTIITLLSAGLVAAFVTQALKQLLDIYLNIDTVLGIFTQGFVAGTVGLFVYALTALLLKSQEMTVFISALRRKLIKKVKVEEEIVAEIG